MGECWLWLQGLDKDGYGEGWFRGRKWRIHRLVWTLLVGPILDGLHLDHMCRARACANPSHLRPATPAENNDAGFSISKLNARKDRCPQDHPYDEGNTGISNNSRYCKTCRRERTRAAYYAKREIAA